MEPELKLELEVQVPKSSHYLRHKFCSKRSYSMNMPSFNSLVPTIHPKYKNDNMSPLRLIQSVINEDKEGGYSEGEEDLKYKGAKMKTNDYHILKLDDLLKKYSASSINLPKLDINNLQKKNEVKYTVECCSSTALRTSMTRIDEETSTPGEGNIMLAAPKKRNSILRHLENKRKYTIG